MSMKKVLMKGNDAVAEGAVQAGCMAYFGYPITPQNELTAYMSNRMVELGRVFVQSESELSAINMVFGAALTGTRSMTTSSSPGISLMQEGLSYMAGCELPAVIVNVQRGGPGLGNISGSQSDYFQATKGGGHGDYHLIVLAPNSVEEMFYHTQKAFDLADKYRTPVMVLADGILGQMREPVNIPDLSSPKDSSQLPVGNWILDGCKNRAPRKINSLYMKEGELEELNLKLLARYKKIKEAEVLYETTDIDNTEIVLVAFGTSSRICKSVIQSLHKQGIKVGMIRPVTLWPFPSDIISKTADKVKLMLVIEMNYGQMLEDVRLAVNGKCPVYFYGRAGGGIPEVDVICNKVKKLL